MGNEFGAADFQPHLIYGLTLVGKLDMTSADAVTIVEGGHHPKMRLRGAYVMQADADNSTGTGNTELKHGAYNAATHTNVNGAVVGTVNKMTVVDQYKDIAEADAVTLEVSATTNLAGDAFVIAMYELIA